MVSAGDALPAKNQKERQYDNPLIMLLIAGADFAGPWAGSMAKSAAAGAEARFKQLCSLGLGAEAVMPALLKELHSLIPASAGNIFVADQKGALANSYGDSATPALTRLYYEEIYCRRETGHTFPEAMRTQSGVHDSEEIMAAIGSDMKAWRRSDHYNLIFRPKRHDFALGLVIRERCRGRGIGMLHLYRELGARWFSSEEKRRLSDLEPFLARALAEPSKSDAPVADSGKRGLVVADTEGRALHFSAEGRRLLFLATHPRVASTTHYSGVDTLPVPLVRLCTDLARIFGDDPCPSAPVYHCQNVWGAFTFHAQRLEGTNAVSGLIGITISHQEPLPIRLMRSIECLGFSTRRAEVGFLMANGSSMENIALRLGISAHTAVAHGRWIYERLNVHTRTELLNRLLAVPV
jgi:DNA-binding CsgD family transcriptional regulator